MKRITVTHFVLTTLLAVRKGSAEIHLEPLYQPLKGENTPAPDYIEGIWPPEHQADDDMWKNFVCKGDNLVMAMQASDSDAGHMFNPSLTSAQSIWSSSDALATWGWHLYQSDDLLKVNFLEDGEEPGHGLRAALAALELPKMPSRDADTGFDIVRVDHFDNPLLRSIDDQTYIEGEKVYRATGASLRLAINTGVGAIMRLELQSPEHAGREDRTPPIPKDELPALQRASDIMWLSWSSRARNPKNLRYFLMVSISNEDTQRTILRAVKAQRLDVWPGRYFSTFFSPDAETAKALLGTPNGRASGYFLAQHKQQLGNMFISGVRVFLASTYSYQPAMVFYVQQELPKRLGENTSQRDGFGVESSAVKGESDGMELREGARLSCEALIILFTWFLRNGNG